MILFPILLALLTGLVILRLCNQHKHLNFFEQIALGFVTALSLFVFELFIGGILFGKLSLIGPIVTFVVSLGLLIYKNRKNKGLCKEISHSIKNDFKKIAEQFVSLKNWKQYLVVGIGLYVLVKLFMVFAININMPTFDEDSVAGWDMKTKIFAENQSLVLDKTSQEFFGTDYGRYPFAAIVDTYFLLPYGEFVNGLSNFISPLVYILSIFLLLGIFLRKTDLFWSSLSVYVFTSLPFVFIHGFGSYRNFASGVFLFMFVFYLIDQLFYIEKEYGGNIGISLPLIILGFISSVIRNEGVMLTGISFLTIIISYHIFKKNKTKEIVKQCWPLVPIAIGYIINKIIFSFYPVGSGLNTGGTEIGTSLISSIFTNINQPGVFLAPFKEMFFHPDYILLFMLILIALIIFVTKYKKLKELWILLTATIVLICVFVAILYGNLNLGLLTHFAFIRYTASIILFLVYFTLIILYREYDIKNKD